MKIKACLFLATTVLICFSVPLSTNEPIVEPTPVLEVILPQIQATTTPTLPPPKPKPVVAVLNSALRPICGCESAGSPNLAPRQFNADGTVVRGVINPQDIGMCQINLTYHGTTALKLGFDLFTEQGNIKYANYLFSKQGSQPWNWSRSCWGSSVPN